ncbi:hypothetical protein [Blastococcus sp. TBT05-19]|uniref:hypothetical protein n=1 Tax=Blastococcus sp. TBT05-19 TaxID=2250581 RepID=UPI0011BE5DD5|nr:hypothetical protein [Blastococcus sp. TBT05-19]
MTATPVAPASFEPLDHRNGVPGDPEELAILARRYADTAAEIEAQAANLAELTSTSQEAWKSDAGDNFVEVAGDLAGRIGRARARYEAAAQALSFFATALEGVQTEAYDAVRRAQVAEESQLALRNSAPDAAAPGATPEQLLAAGAEHQAHQRALFAAEDDLAAARRDYFFAVESYDRAARAAAEILSTGRSGDDLADDWWDENAWWIDVVLDAIAVVALVLVIVAIVVAVLVTGGLALAGAVMTASTVLGCVSLAVRSGMWATGNATAEDVFWDFVGVMTFGVGKLATAGVRGALGVSTRLAGARTGGAVVTGAGAGTRLTRGVTFVDEDLAAALSAIHRTRTAGGAGAQLTALTVLADVMVVGAVTAPNLYLTGKAVADLPEAAGGAREQAAEDRANRVAIVDRWSMPLAGAR